VDHMGDGTSQGSTVNPHEPGTYEFHNPHLYSSYSTDLRSQRSLIMSPSISFKTERSLVSTFILMLQILEAAEFAWVFSYSGPRVDFILKRGETKDVDLLIEALEGEWETRIPLGGMKAALLYDREEPVKAKLKVGGFGSTKVRVKMKGTMLMSDWNEIRRGVRKKFGV
jgi:hypothetical protein